MTFSLDHIEKEMVKLKIASPTNKIVPKVTSYNFNEPQNG
jgi:hypothetical protein